MVVRVEILFAVLAALMFGTGFYMSGTVSRRLGPVTVAYWTQYGVVAVALALLLGQPVVRWSPEALIWGTVGALGGVAGSLCLYAALSRATFTLAVGASTVTTTVTPALVAMALLGEAVTIMRLVLVGLAVLTVWLLVSQKRSKGVAVVTSPLPVVSPQEGGNTEEEEIARSSSQAEAELPGRSGPGAGLLSLAAGLGYAIELVGIAQVPRESFTQGLSAWAVVSLLVMLVVFMVRGGRDVRGRMRRLLPSGSGGALVILAGGFSATGMLLFNISSGSIGLATTSAIVAVYPAVPILLAVAILRERPSRRGWAGLACAALVVGLGALSTVIQG